MEWKQLLASITGSVDEELELRNAYLAAENRILRNLNKRQRVLLTDAERQMLAAMGLHWADRPWQRSPRLPSPT
jgi:hypothetical protein